MTRTLFKIKCEKGHKSNALIWDEETIQNYIESKKCNSCGSPLHQYPNKNLDNLKKYQVILNKIIFPHLSWIQKKILKKSIRLDMNQQ